MKVFEILKTTRLVFTWICLPLLVLCGVFIAASTVIGAGQRQTIISFVSSRGLGKNILQLMDTQKQITVHLSQNIIHCCAKWSPKGDEVIFDTFNGSGTNALKYIYRMTADGRQPRPLIALTEPSAQSGAWSPDGRYVAYLTFRFTFVAEIAVLDTQTGVSQQLTNIHTYAEAPVWSPDGRFIVFTVQQSRSNWDIGRINADGSGYQNLTQTQGSDNLPAISPDGRAIAFISNRGGKQLLYRMDADGGNLHALTGVSVLEIAPSWSPDGRYILFVSDDGAGLVHISRVNADGSDLRRLAVISGSEAPPVWSPDGTQILYASVNDSGTTYLYMMDADGGQVRKLADDSNRETNLAWYPG